jgi:transient receptor potential cation channel subfamily M protein 3
MSDLEDNKYHIFSTDIYQERIPRNRELKMSKKLYEFYTAPITKFWANSVRNDTNSIFQFLIFHFRLPI